MIKFILRNTLIAEYPKNTAEQVMRVLRKHNMKFSVVGNEVRLKKKDSLTVVVGF